MTRRPARPTAPMPLARTGRSIVTGPRRGEITPGLSDGEQASDGTGFSDSSDSAGSRATADTAQSCVTPALTASGRRGTVGPLEPHDGETRAVGGARVVRVKLDGAQVPADRRHAMTAGADSATDADPASPTVRRAASRILALDVVRGVAVCGIVLVNIPPLVGFQGYADDGSALNPIRFWLDLLVQQRFFPIFSLLFGIGFGLMWRAAQRAVRPRAVMLRRMLFLLLIGAVHTAIRPGEVLLPYALCGLLLCIPLTWAPRVVPLVLGLVMLPLALVGGGQLFLIPAIVTLGFALALYDVPRLVTQRPRIMVVTAAISWPLAIVLTAWQARLTGDHFTDVGAVAGWVMSIAYVSALTLTLETRARVVVARAFAPLGRMALTLYVSSTAIGLLTMPFARDLGFDATTAGYTRIMLFCALVIGFQMVCARWWLAEHDQGPLEAVWRRVTWGAQGRPALSAPSRTVAG